MERKVPPKINGTSPAPAFKERKASPRFAYRPIQFRFLGTGDDGKNKSAGTLRQPAYVKISVEAAPWCGPDYRWDKEMPEWDSFEVDYVRPYRPKP